MCFSITSHTLCQRSCRYTSSTLSFHSILTQALGQDTQYGKFLVCIYYLLLFKHGLRTLEESFSINSSSYHKDWFTLSRYCYQIAHSLLVYLSKLLAHIQLESVLLLSTLQPDKDPWFICQLIIGRFILGELHQHHWS